MENKKATPQISNVTKNNGRMNRSKEMPADLIATSSKLSPSRPNVINDESKIASGNANGTSAALWYQINFKIMLVLRPLPTKSSIQSQKNCMINTSNVIKNVAANGPINALTTSISNFLITYL